jgi:PqqD family protein of HPr-rel-A system
MGRGTKLRPRAGVVMRPEEDEAFLFDPDRGTLKLLNPTGVDVWRLLDGQRDAQDLAREVAARYPEADADAVAGDVAQFLEELVAAGLVEAVGGD